MHKLYQITNTVNGKSYIGITKLDVTQRFAIHASSARTPKYPIQYAIAKYGEDNFTVKKI